MSDDTGNPHLKKKFGEALSACEKAMAEHDQALEQVRLLRFRPDADKAVSDAGLALLEAQTAAVGTGAAVQEAKRTVRALNWALDVNTHVTADAIEYAESDERFVLAE